MTAIDRFNSCLCVLLFMTVSLGPAPLAGQATALSELRGNKVFLATWASW